MKKVLFLVLLLAVCILAGCSTRTKAPEAENAAVDASINKESERMVDEGAEVKIVEKSQSYDLDLKAGIDGNVSFEEDASKTAVLDFLADGQEKSIVLEDDAGLIWELTVPPNALADRQSITITSMKNISSSLDELTGGVVLKPDGLKFIEPVTLSVKSGDIEKSGFVFSGNSNGKELEFSDVQRNQGSIDMKLYHFSTAFADTLSETTIEKLAGMAARQRKSAEAAARELLKKPIEAPFPPSISLKCHHDTEAQDDVVLNQFIDEFNKPELEVLNALLSASRSNELLTGNMSDSEFGMELRVMNRLMKKANALIVEYRGQEDKYIAVSRAALETERRNQLLAGSGGDNSLLPKLAAWAKEIAEKYLKELMENHEYKNIHPIQKIAREAALAGADMFKYVNEELRNALKFKVEYTNKMNTGRDWGFAFELKGEASLDLSLVTQQNAIEGEGVGEYTDFKVNGLEEGKAVMDNMATTFPIKFIIADFNPCESETFNIYMDRFASESEKVTIIPDDPEIPPKSTSGGAVQGGTAYSFDDIKQEGLFKFTVDLKNGSVNTAEQTFTRDNERVAIELTLKLIHTP